MQIFSGSEFALQLILGSKKRPAAYPGDMTKATGRPVGRPRKTPAVAVIHGDRPRLPAPTARPALTDPPADLSELERPYWVEHAAELERMGRLTTLSAPVLADLCRWRAMAASMRAQIAREGLTITGQKGEPVRHPLILPLASVSNQVNLARNSFGMSPAAAERFAPVQRLDDLPGADLLSGGSSWR